MQSSLIGAKWDSRCACERKCVYKSLSLIDTDDYIRLMCGPPREQVRGIQRWLTAEGKRYSLVVVTSQQNGVFSCRAEGRSWN